MTFRTRPVVKRIPRPSWDSRDRRNFYLNLGFGIAVLAALVILGVAVALSYYNDHLVPVGSVDGQSITKDELRERWAEDKRWEPDTDRDDIEPMFKQWKKAVQRTLDWVED